MDYTQESVDALVAATQAAHDQLGVASVELAKAASLSSAAMDAAANLVHVSPPKPPTTLRKAYLGSSDFSALTGTTPTCHRHYYGLSGNGFNPQAALSRTQDDARRTGSPCSRSARPAWPASRTSTRCRRSTRR